MDGGARPPKLRVTISPVDRQGRSISPAVLSAAEEVVRRAIQHAEHLLIDPAIATTLLEDAAGAVSRVLQSGRTLPADSVHDLPSYLFRAFLRRANRIRRQRVIHEARLLSYINELPRSINPRGDLEVQILIDELITRCDPKIRDMFYRRVHGFSWNEIAASYGTSAHAAESSFWQAIRKLAQKLGFKPKDRPTDED